MSNKQEYGVLIYDIPVDNMRLYNRIWKSIRSRALHLNHSVYLIKWGHQVHLQRIIDEAVNETGQQLVAKFIKFDDSEERNVESYAVQALQRDIQDVLKRLEKKINSVREESKNVGDAFFKRSNKLLKQTHTLAIMFGFEGNIEGILKQAKKVVETHWEADRARRNAARQ